MAHGLYLMIKVYTFRCPSAASPSHLSLKHTFAKPSLIVYIGNLTLYCWKYWDEAGSSPDLGREAAVERVPEVTERECKVLVEEVLKELAHSQVGPATVNEQKTFQVTELCHGEVASQHGLHAFLTTDTDTDMCRCHNSKLHARKY